MTSANVHPIRGTGNDFSNAGRTSSVDSGGDGPHDGDMNERVAILEAKWDSVVPTLATKSDVAEARADIKAWMLATVLIIMFGMASLIFALTSSINTTLSTLKPSTAPAAVQPIIIQQPAYPAPGVSTAPAVPAATSK